jgi:diadenosine tetraphosphate (Ap4A) HIT family hydrolase
MVSLGTRVYLALTEFEELVSGHCLIVPLQHHLSMLESDDDTWEEVKVSSASLQPEAINAYSLIY